MSENKCLCGKVSIKLNSLDPELGVCHCDMCRKWSGGPYISVKHAGAVTIDGDEHVTYYNSSDWAERAFCSSCGTHLFYRLKDKAETYFPAGLLENQTGMVLDHQIFIDKKPSYYSFAEQTKDFTSEQVLAMFGGDEQA